MSLRSCLDCSTIKRLQSVWNSHLSPFFSPVWCAFWPPFHRFFHLLSPASSFFQLSLPLQLPNLPFVLIHFEWSFNSTSFFKHCKYIFSFLIDHTNRDLSNKVYRGDQLDENLATISMIVFVNYPVEKFWRGLKQPVRTWSISRFPKWRNRIIFELLAKMSESACLYISF